MRTREWIPGQGWVEVDASFRRYADPASSTADWLALMQGSRYADVLNAPDLDSAITAVGRSGYATDPAYADKLRKLQPRTPAQLKFYNDRKAEAVAAGSPAHLAELAAKLSALETGWGESAPGNNYYGIKMASAGTPDVQQGLFQMSEQPVPYRAPQPEAPKMAENGLMGGNTLERLMADPLFLMGASILANNNSRNTGEVIGRGLLGGSAAYQAMQASRENNEIRRAQLQQMQNPRSANIAEYEYLVRQGIPADQAMRMAFAGNAGYGEKIQMAGNVPVITVTNPDGTTSVRPLTEEELGYRADVIGSEKRTASEAEDMGKQQAGLRGEINKFVMTAPPLIKQTDQLIADIEAGKYQDTGPIVGRIKEYWSPELADLQFKSTEQVLQNLQIVNLAPVTIKELELMGNLYAGAYKTPEQNLAVLRYLSGRMKERMRRMRKLYRHLEGGGRVEDLPRWVEDEFDDFDAVGGQAPDIGAAPQMPTTVQQKPAGMPDDQWQELLRLRQQTGGL